MRGTTQAVLGSAVLGFVLGLEVMEPLSQEIDQPNYNDSYPVPRGEIMLRHLAAPAVALVPLSVVATVATVLSVGGTTRAIAPAAILALPTLLGGITGGVVSIVRDTPDPLKSVRTDAFVPPEMAGFTTTLRLLWPLVISTLGTCTVLLVRSASATASRWSAPPSVARSAHCRGRPGRLLGEGARRRAPQDPSIHGRRPRPDHGAAPTKKQQGMTATFSTHQLSKD